VSGRPGATPFLSEQQLDVLPFFLGHSQAAGEGKTGSIY
jgi:hypothetical protein